VVVGGATVVAGLVGRDVASEVGGVVVEAVAGAAAVVGWADVATTEVAEDEVSPESPVQAATRTGTVSATRATPMRRVRVNGPVSLR
jgi:hypothetical protein